MTSADHKDLDMARTIATLIALVIGTDANPLSLALSWATRPNGVTHEAAHKYRTRTFRALPHVLKGTSDVEYGQAVWNVSAHYALTMEPKNVKEAREVAAVAVRVVRALARMEGCTVATLNARADLWRHEAIVSRANDTLRTADDRTAQLEDAIAATA